MVTTSSHEAPAHVGPAFRSRPLLRPRSNQPAKLPAVPPPKNKNVVILSASKKMREGPHRKPNAILREGTARVGSAFRSRPLRRPQAPRRVRHPNSLKPKSLLQSPNQFLFVDKSADGLKVVFRFATPVHLWVSCHENIAILGHEREVPLVICSSFMGTHCFSRL